MLVSTVRTCQESDLDQRPTKSWLKRFLGFVVDPNQVNVALTRAREGLCVIGKVACPRVGGWGWGGAPWVGGALPGGVAPWVGGASPRVGGAGLPWGLVPWLGGTGRGSSLAGGLLLGVWLHDWAGLPRGVAP